MLKFGYQITEMFILDLQTMTGNLSLRCGYIMCNLACSTFAKFSSSKLLLSLVHPMRTTNDLRIINVSNIFDLLQDGVWCLRCFLIIFCFLLRPPPPPCPLPRKKKTQKIFIIFHCFRSISKEFNLLITHLLWCDITKFSWKRKHLIFFSFLLDGLWLNQFNSWLV